MNISFFFLLGEAKTYPPSDEKQRINLQWPMYCTDLNSLILIHEKNRYNVVHLTDLAIFEPTSAYAQWALLSHFLAICLSVLCRH